MRNFNLHILFSFVLVITANTFCLAQNKPTKYFLSGRAFINNRQEIYKVEITDDGSGKLTGETVSIDGNKKIVGTVVGKIDYARKKMFLQEVKVTNLRPGETQSNYCFFIITANYIIKDGQTIVQGPLVGKSPDGNICTNGSVLLLSPKNVEVIHKEFVQKTISLKNTIVEKVNTVVNKVEKKLPTIVKPPTPIVKKEKSKEQTNTYSSTITDTNLSSKEKTIAPTIDAGATLYEFENDSLVFIISDYDKEDGDRINVYVNKKLVLSNYELKNAPEFIAVPLKEIGNPDGLNFVEVEALNEGYYNLNSTKLVVLDGSFEYVFYACNKFQQKKQLVLKKKL